MSVAVETSTFAFGFQSFCLQEATNPRTAREKGRGTARDFPSCCHELVILGSTVTIAGEDCNLSRASFYRVRMPGATPISVRRAETTEEKLASGE